MGYTELGLLGFSEFCVESWNGDSPLRVETFFSCFCSLLRAAHADAWIRHLDPGMGDNPDLGRGGVSTCQAFQEHSFPFLIQTQPRPLPRPVSRFLFLRGSNVAGIHLSAHC